MIHIFRWKNVRILVLHQRPLLARVEVYDGREVVVEPPVWEPLSVVVQQAASLVMSPGGAGGAVGGGTEISTLHIQKRVAMLYSFPIACLKVKFI